MTEEDQDQSSEGEQIPKPGFWLLAVEPERGGMRPHSGMSCDGERCARHFDEQAAETAPKKEEKNPVEDMGLSHIELLTRRQVDGRTDPPALCTNKSRDFPGPPVDLDEVIVSA